MIEFVICSILFSKKEKSLHIYFLTSESQDNSELHI